MRPKEQLREILIQALEQARSAGELNFDTLPAFEVEATKQADHGDLATNLAMVLAKPARMAPRKIAEIISKNLAAPPAMLQKVEIAGPGFINFFIEESYWRQVIQEIYDLGPVYARRAHRVSNGRSRTRPD